MSEAADLIVKLSAAALKPGDHSIDKADLIRAANEIARLQTDNDYLMSILERLVGDTDSWPCRIDKELLTQVRTIVWNASNEDHPLGDSNDK